MRSGCAVPSSSPWARLPLPAAALSEALGEVLQELAELLVGLGLHLAVGADRAENARALVAHRREELLLEARDLVHRHLIEIAFDAGEDGDDLLLDRQRLVLILLQELDQARAAREQLLRGGVE